jgi:hypothetical protein
VEYKEVFVMSLVYVVNHVDLVYAVMYPTASGEEFFLIKFMNMVRI